MLTPERRWDAGLWAALAEAGLTGVGLPEEAGGSGGELADAVAIVRTLAAGAAAVPVAEQLLVAGPARGRGRPGPARRRRSRSPSRVGRRGDRARRRTTATGPGRFTLTGTVDRRRVGRGGAARRRPAPARGRAGRCWRWSTSSALEATDAANLAGEPRGSLVLDDVAGRRARC